MNDGPQESWAQPEGAAHWRMVRAFTLTGGRTEPSRDVFTLITLVSTVDLPLPSVGQRLQPEHLRILRMCAQPLAVAEISAYLDLPVSVTTILLSDLLELGRILARPPIHVAASPQIALLQKVRNGLARL